MQSAEAVAPAAGGETASAPAKLLLESAPDEPSGTIKLDVSTSAPVSLYDQLGPTIVSSDGTLSRIGNWAEMGEAERARVLRVLGARNKVRLEERKAVMDAAAAAEQRD